MTPLGTFLGLLVIAALAVLGAALIGRIERRLNDHVDRALGPEKSNVTRVDFQNNVRVRRGA